MRWYPQDLEQITLIATETTAAPTPLYRYFSVSVPSRTRSRRRAAMVPPPAGDNEGGGGKESDRSGGEEDPFLGSDPSAHGGLSGLLAGDAGLQWTGP